MKKQRIFALLLALTLLTVLLGACKRSFVTNEFTAPAELQPVPAGERAFDAPDGTFSFLYPETASVEWTQDGAYLYSVSQGQMPYILIYYAQGSFDPDSYFSSYASLVKRTYADAALGKISQTHVGDKTLYMLRSAVKGEGTTYVIDRYLEIYPDCSIQYTVKSNHAASEDALLASVVQSMCPVTGIYGQARPQSVYTDLRSVSNANVGISMSVLTGMNVQEIPIGLLAQDENLLLFASYQNSDAAGSAIYDSNDFLDRIGAVEGLLQAQLGADSAAIQNGVAEKIGNYDAYVFPLQLSMGGFAGSGRLYLINNPAGVGCYVLYYAAANETVEATGQQCMSSFMIDAAPGNTPSYQQFTDSRHTFTFLYRSGLTDATATDMGGLAAIELTDGDFLLVSPVSAADEGVSSASEYLLKYLQTVRESNPDVVYDAGEITQESGGRYAFSTLEVSYVYDGVPRSLTLSGCDGADGTIWVVIAAGTEEYASVLSTLRGDILWSFRTT